ncbi:hypothetical protein [Actinomadura sp. SCN-SB]|uniref:hypothetical protein n=1 Tax=Actinomadura sp. SCN-SB TaxID=3373092 RepID=UPI003750ABE3
MPNDPAPLLNGELWRTVLDRAGRRCECRAECGRKHKDGGGRCKNEHDRPRPLHSVPREATSSWVAAATLPPEALYALCPPCHAGIEAARRSARNAAVAEAHTPEALF